MSENKDNNKERLQKQAEKSTTGMMEDMNNQQRYGGDLSIDPAQHLSQTGSTKVQNPDRNLARGGNNTNFKHKSG